MMGVRIDAASRPGKPGLWTLRPGNRQLLRLVFSAYEETAAWPSTTTLQRDVDHLGTSLDVAARAARMPSALGRVTGDGRIVLTVRGLAYIPEAHDLLEGFLGSVRLAARRYRRGDRTAPARITQGDLIAELNLGTEQAERVSGLMEEQVRLFAPAGRLLAFEIQAAIRHFSGVRSAGDYLTAEAELRRSLRAERRPPRRFRGWLAKPQLAIWERIVLAVVATGASAALIWGVAQLSREDGPEPKDPAPHGAVGGSRERAISD